MICMAMQAMTPSVGGAGNDAMTGGAGDDTVIYAGLKSSYTINWSNASQTFTVRSAAEGQDTLSGIENLKFSDTTLRAADYVLYLSKVNHLPTGAVSIVGKQSLGQTLVASHQLADADGLGIISYQWKADNVPISGATNTSLTLAAEQVGKKITVVASYVDKKGVTESVSSGDSYLKTSYELAQPKQWISFKSVVDAAGKIYTKDSVLNVMQTVQVDLNNEVTSNNV